MELLFVKSESTFSYFEATRHYIDKHGKPLALYSDKAGVFRVNNKHATGGEGHTQFGRAMHELNIQTICAETSEAKGRVERAHLTLQDRLVKELRLQSINSMEAANAFAEAYIADYNRRFGKAPRHDFDVHRAVEHSSPSPFRRYSGRFSFSLMNCLPVLIPFTFATTSVTCSSRLSNSIWAL